MVSQAVLHSMWWRSSHHGRSESRGRKGQHLAGFLLFLHPGSWVMKCYGPNSGHTPPPLQLIFSRNTPADSSGTHQWFFLHQGYEMCYECSSGLSVFSVLWVQASPSARQSSVLLLSDNNSPVIPKRKLTLTVKDFSIFPIFLWFGFTLLSTS